MPRSCTCFSLVVMMVLGAPAAVEAQQPPRPSNEAQALAQAVGAAFPNFPEGDQLAAMVKAGSAYPLGSAENPVRVGSFREAYAYIGRLRCADGSQPKAGRSGPIGKMPFGRMVDAYRVDCGAVAPGDRTVHVDAYHSGHNERRAPDGFKLARIAR